MNNEIEKLKLENEKLKNELNNEILNKNKKMKNKIKLNKKMIIILSIILFVILLSVAIVLYVKNTSIKFLTNKTWIGTKETFYLIDSDGEKVELGGDSEFIEFYDDKSFVQYVLVEDKEENIYLNSLFYGTYKKRGNKIYLKAEKYTIDGEYYKESTMKETLIYNPKKNTFYAVDSTDKYMPMVDSDGNKKYYKESDEQVEYKINYKKLLDYYFVDYNN